MCDQERYQEELESARIERDTWRSLNELSEKIDQLYSPGGFMKYKTDGYILFIKIFTKDVPKIIFSLKITADLQLTSFRLGWKLQIPTFEICVQMI